MAWQGSSSSGEREGGTRKLRPRAEHPRPRGPSQGGGGCRHWGGESSKGKKGSHMMNPAEPRPSPGLGVQRLSLAQGTPFWAERAQRAGRGSGIGARLGIQPEASTLSVTSHPTSQGPFPTDPSPPVRTSGSDPPSRVALGPAHAGKSRGGRGARDRAAPCCLLLRRATEGQQASTQRWLTLQGS